MRRQLDRGAQRPPKVGNHGRERNLIGIAPSQSVGTNASPLKGILDEVRIATVERPAGWIATEFANQSSPQTFYSVGPAQIVP